MRTLALGLLLLVGSTACSGGDGNIPDEQGHGDPPCAFDETGCVPAELVAVVEGREDGPWAELRGTSPLEANSWVQEGAQGTVHWRLPDGTRHDHERTLATAIVEGTPDPVAPRIELLVESDADQFTVQIARVREGGPVPGVEVFRELEPSVAPSVVRLEHGSYVLRLHAFWPQGEAEFYFIVRRV
jgi:hypothetical protein